jgi:hypothetical protein
MKSSGMKNTECDGRLQFLPLFYALSIKCQFGILIVNLLFHDFNTNFRYLFSWLDKCEQYSIWQITITTFIDCSLLYFDAM